MSLPARFQRARHPRIRPPAPQRVEPSPPIARPRTICSARQLAEDLVNRAEQSRRDREPEAGIRRMNEVFTWSQNELRAASTMTPAFFPGNTLIARYAVSGSSTHSLAVFYCSASSTA